ncbi:hypothetical protein SPONL_656 [uncultured Candidatus Thioglobus sp.]|nr:hypothetical protein SPONL_656 [uncultured Candidatus Thioglobus sp.]
MNQENRCNNFQKYIKKIKNLLVLATPSNFNEDKEAEIALVIDNLLSKLSLKNKKQNNEVKEKLNDIRRNLATLSKNIKEQLYQETSALMIENLNSLLKEVKHKHF